MDTKLKTKTGIPDLDIPGSLDENGDQVKTKNDDEKTKVLLDYFNSVFTVENKENIPDINNFTEIEMPEIIITEELVHKKLSKLNVNKSTGPDKLHPKLLYEIRNEIAKPLQLIYI